MVDERINYPDEDLTRPNYFSGKLLTIEDYADEQAYFLAKLRRHNRYLHGWGVVHGLDVVIRGDLLSVLPGYAIDCVGNEILVRERIEWRLSFTKRMLYVVVENCEEMVGPVPVPFAGSETEQQDWAYIREVSQIDIRDVDPGANHITCGPGTPGCGVPHAVTIACLEQGSRGWRVILTARR